MTVARLVGRNGATGCAATGAAESTGGSIGLLVAGLLMVRGGRSASWGAVGSSGFSGDGRVRVAPGNGRSARCVVSAGAWAAVAGGATSIRTSGNGLPIAKETI